MDNKAKTCTMCGRTLTLDNFKKVSFAEDGHAHHCKDCARKKRLDKIESCNNEGEIVKDCKGGGNPELAKFKNYELLNEIKYRGYRGKLQIVREVEI